MENFKSIDQIRDIMQSVKGSFQIEFADFFYLDVDRIMDNSYNVNIVDTLSGSYNFNFIGNRFDFDSARNLGWDEIEKMRLKSKAETKTKIKVIANCPCCGELHENEIILLNNELVIRDDVNRQAFKCYGCMTEFEIKTGYRCIRGLK